MRKVHSATQPTDSLAGGLGGAGQSGNGRDILPGNLVPTAYNVWLTPSLVSFTFDGTVAIDVACIESTNVVVLNSKNLTIHKAEVTVGDVTQFASDISFNTDKEQVTFTFADQIPAGSSASVYVEFTGIHNEQMAGFYKSSYTDEAGNKKNLVATQFEATDCRQAFPSYDEPALKATFECTLVVPEELTALNNMPEVATTFFTNTDGKKVKEVKFARTPLMSTYLVAFVVGDLESIETVATPKSPENAEPITIRLFTVKGLVSQGTFALDVAARTHQFFSEYFNEAFPLPKSDLVAIPDFGAGAMENWGLVTYRNVALLCEAENTTASAKKEIAYTVAHELAHQWFGNLVTMSWWNDLWLNEGFATFVGWLAVDFLFPEWEVWTNFINAEFNQALQLDGLRSSHPIDVDVKSAAEVGEIFDAISYSKGASVIRMLNGYLGRDVFMNGVRSYLQEFKYKNTVTADLWRHLSASSGKDISTLMHGWTKETGYPLITVESQTYDESANTLTVTLSQSRFLSAGGLTPEEDTVTWWVPVTASTHLTGKTGVSKHVLHDKAGTITFPYNISENAFWKLNFGAEGLYRVKYSDEQVKQISHTLEVRTETFSVGDRILFLSDAMALTNAGLGSITTVLNLIKALFNETNFNVLESIANTIQGLLSSFYLESETVLEGIKALGRSVFSPKVATLGYEFSESDDYFTQQIRGLAISLADRCSDVNVQAELASRFGDFVGGKITALHPEIRTVAFRSVLSTATPETADARFSAVFAVYMDPATQAEAKDEALRVLGAIRSSEHIDKLLAMTFDPEIIRSQDMYAPIAGLATSNPDPAIIRPLLREWFRNNWDKIYAKFESGFGLLGYIFSASFSTSVGEEVVKEIEDWASGAGLDEEAVARRVKETAGIRRRIDQGLESIKSKTSLVARERETLVAYFT
ncbi:hypothetical protein HK100_004184 [Physocladia obscura]|uniref:Aminopeptidase n=1 Tax=Physocladia obscura TaxID=109957 RepID=A0AAD5XL04_9FUNG|nr:hypothetical protein HK100_004184 [Physocladia obscura]